MNSTITRAKSELCPSWCESEHSEYDLSGLPDGSSVRNHTAQAAAGQVPAGVVLEISAEESCRAPAAAELAPPRVYLTAEGVRLEAGDARRLAVQLLALAERLDDITLSVG